MQQPAMPHDAAGLLPCHLMQGLPGTVIGLAHLQLAICLEPGESCLILTAYCCGAYCRRRRQATAKRRVMLPAPTWRKRDDTATHYMPLGHRATIEGGNARPVGVIHMHHGISFCAGMSCEYRQQVVSLMHRFL